MLLVLDNGSVFTQNLIDFLEEKKILFEKKTPFDLDLDQISKYESFILSGRRKNEKKINSINSKIVTHSVENNKKLLGICYGAEILSLTLGGTIRKLQTPQKGEEEIIITKDNALTNENLFAFESHGFEISKLPKSLISLGNSKSCKNELIQYEGKLIFGTQFHPEMSSEGKQLIEKFCIL